MIASRRSLRGVLVALLALSPAAARGAAVTVTVDSSADVHYISPLIYGVNYASAEQAQSGAITLTRWGGNSTTRYNYLIDTYNTGNDYFFENIPGCWSAADHYCNPVPADPKGQSSANAFLQRAASWNLATLFTVPTIGWVAKAPPLYSHPFVCGFPRSFSANQDQFDPYDAGCGNGKQGGKDLAPPPPSTTSTAVDAAWVGAWVSYLTGRFGPSNTRRIYALDNEPALWSSTHRDVRTARLGYDELWQRMRDHAAAILQADPTALIAGPAEWGWPNYLCSDADEISKGCSAASPDRAKHGGVELVAWLLDQARAYEQQHGKRLLHFLDLHYYPQGGNPPENTRSLYDPGYTDPSWINAQIRLIPRMRDWVAQHYPGTRLLVSEYDFGHHNDATGAVTYAEVLGIFGREGLDAATAWSPPAATEAAFAAYKLYGNYDGQGGRFLPVSVRATVSGGAVRAFASVDVAGTPRDATVVLCNEDAAPADVTVRLGSLSLLRSAAFYRYAGGGSGVVQDADPRLIGDQATVRVAALSCGLLVAHGPQPPFDDFGGWPPVDLAPPAGSDQGPPAGPGPGGCGCDITGAPGVPGISGMLALLLGLGVLRRRSARQRAVQVAPQILH